MNQVNYRILGGNALKEKPSQIPCPYSKLPIGCRKNLYGMVPDYDVPEKNKNIEDEFIHFSVLATLIQDGNLRKLAECLERDPKNIEFSDSTARTSYLHVAARYLDANLWEMLSTHSEFMTYLDWLDFRGSTPLLVASWFENFIAAAKLVEFGANPTMRLRDNKRTVLHFCGQHETLDVCQILLTDPRSKNIIDDIDIEGDSPLFMAIRNLSIVTNLLIDNGANISAVNPVNQRNVLHTAVIFSNYKFLQYLLENMDDPSSELTRCDINGDTPLTLAVGMSDTHCINLLLQLDSSTETLDSCRKYVHTWIHDNKRDILDTILTYNPDKSFFEMYDSEGRTPLILAVELKRLGIIKMLEAIKVELHKRNLYTGDSVLHTAANTQDEKIITAILTNTNYNRLSPIENNLGLTPYELVLAKGSYAIWKIWKMRANISAEFENSSEESSLFIAAKAGNYILTLATLFSTQFYGYFDQVSRLAVEDLFHLEVKRMIFGSDVFIALGLVSEHSGWETSPHQEQLFQTTSKGMNIFHACVLGGNIDCLIFMYNYCRLFKFNKWQIDAPDDEGNTPLFYGILNGHSEIVKYLLSHGCNLSNTNSLGWSPLHALAGNEKMMEVLEGAISDCVHFQDNIDEIDSTGEIMLSYILLQADNIYQMKLVSSMFNILMGPKQVTLLTNPVIEYFILYKWEKIRPIVTFKLFVHALMVISFSCYMNFNLSEILSVHYVMVSTSKWLAVSFSILHLLLSIPTLFYREYHYSFNFFPPLLIICYMTSRQTTREALELGALAILTSWLSMIANCHVTKMSYQLAVLQKTLLAILKLLPLMILVLTAFSLCCFALFNEYWEFNNPFHSFITLAFKMREGEIDTPAIPSSEHDWEPMIPEQVPLFPPTHANTKTMMKHIEIRNVFIEGVLFLAFRFFVIICAFNLLVHAAIHEVTEAEYLGKLQKLRNYVSELTFWEKILNSKIYYMFVNTLQSFRILRLTTREDTRIPTHLNPMDHLVSEFDVSELRFLQQAEKSEPKPLAFFNSIWTD